MKQLVLHTIRLLAVLVLCVDYVASQEDQEDAASVVASTTAIHQVAGDDDFVSTDAKSNPSRDEDSNKLLVRDQDSTETMESSQESLSSIASDDDHRSLDDEIVQAGPLVDLFGPQLLSFALISESQAEIRPHLTLDALRDKKVIGVYFSADWCGPCRKFTPELVSFYDKINQRRGRKDEFEIVWVSRCRDVQSYEQYFSHMGGWYALPPQEAMGERGARLSELYKVKGIPTLVLLDEMGSIITKDGRNMIPKDKAGIGFPWRNPLVTLYTNLIPRSLRLLVRTQIASVKDKVLVRMQRIVMPKKKRNA